MRSVTLRYLQQAKRLNHVSHSRGIAAYRAERKNSNTFAADAAMATRSTQAATRRSWTGPAD
jgi:hypothetical protein